MGEDTATHPGIGNGIIVTSGHKQAFQQSGSRFDFGGIADTYDQWYETRVGHAYDTLEK